MAAGQSIVCAAGGNCELIIPGTGGKDPHEFDPPIPPSAFGGRRFSWRELIVDQ